MSDKQRTYFCIDMKSFFASVECAERGLNPFETNLVVADKSRGNGALCLAITPKMKALGAKNRCRIFEIPKGIDYIVALPRMKKYIEYAADIYEIYLKYINTQLFNFRDTIMITISQDHIVFNTALVRKFNGARHIEMLFNPKDFIIAFRPCKPDNPNAIEWTKTNKDGDLMGNVKGCKGFSNIIFDYLEWNPEYIYRCLGVKRSKRDEGLIFIDLKNPEVCVSEDEPSENIQLGKLRKRVVLFSKEYVHTYGEEYYQNLFSCRLFMIDVKGLWNAYLEGTAIKSEDDLIEKAHMLFDEYMKELKLEV